MSDTLLVEKHSSIHLTISMRCWRKISPQFPTHSERLTGMQVSFRNRILEKFHCFITGTSRHTLEWIGQNGDGWMYYPRNLAYQSTAVESWRRVTPYFKPFMQSLYI